MSSIGNGLAKVFALRADDAKDFFRQELGSRQNGDSPPERKEDGFLT